MIRDLRAAGGVAEMIAAGAWSQATHASPSTEFAFGNIMRGDRMASTHSSLLADSELDRRTLLTGLAGAIPTLSLSGMIPQALRSAHGADEGAKRNALEGFIVSDAHFGWKEDEQPPPATIAAMMGRIITRFPNLDLFLDTGDAHHGGSSDADRGNWTDIIAGGCGRSPFYFVAGNHDIDDWNGKCDIEARCGRLGSVSSRPYYSFDLMGIHFVALPELIYMCYVTREALDWLELDLAVNDGRTTIILSHNAIRGTTLGHEDPGYRQLANSEEVLALLERHRNVLAWMHGHNHTYEMVRKGGMLFVSNGRIGGFIPPDPEKWAGKHLGGIHFEIGRDRAIFRAYSASEDKFLDALGYPHLSQTLEVKTTFDAAAPAAVSYGCGSALSGERLPVVSHHAGEGTRSRIFLAGAKGPTINENAALDIYTERTHPAAPDKHILPGFKFEPHDDELWVWANPGIRIAARPSLRDVTTVLAPGRERAERSYYRCVPGKRYRATLDLDAQDGGQTVQLWSRVYDAALREADAIAHKPVTLQHGEQTLYKDFDIPARLDARSIYSDPANDELLHLLIEMRFSHLTSGVLIKRCSLGFTDAGQHTLAPSIQVGNTEIKHPGILAPDKPASFDLQRKANPRDVWEISAGGNGRVTWLVRETGIDWQVRNAPAVWRDGCLEIGPLRNRFSTRNEIVVAPMRRMSAPYVQRLRHIHSARIRPHTAAHPTLAIQVSQIMGPAQIDICTRDKPRRIRGAEILTTAAEGRVTLSVPHTGEVAITF